MTLLRKRFSIFLFLDLLCQLTDQKVLKSPGYTAKILSLVAVFFPSAGKEHPWIFPFFPFILVLTCPLLPLFWFFPSSLYLRVIHPLFSLLSMSRHAFWAANIKEVVAAQQSLGRAEQGIRATRMPRAIILGQLLQQAWEQGWKRQLLPRDQPGLSLHLSKVHNYSDNKIFTLLSYFCSLSGSSPYRLFSNYWLESFSHVLPSVENNIINICYWII